MLFCGRDGFEKENRDDDDTTEDRFVSKNFKRLKESHDGEDPEKEKNVHFEKANKEWNASSKSGFRGNQRRGQGKAATSARKETKQDQVKVSAFRSVSNSNYDYRGRVEIDTRADMMCTGASFE